MSCELAASGILTNLVMAGFTPAEKPVPEAVIQQAADAAAIQRVTEPGEVAELTVFLCSARNTNITGRPSAPMAISSPRSTASEPPRERRVRRPAFRIKRQARRGQEIFSARIASSQGIMPSPLSVSALIIMP